VTENANEQLPPVLCIPARDEADDIAALMLVQLLQKRGIPAQRLSSAALAGECVEAVGRGQARIACVTSVPPFGYTHARYLCRRLRSQFPELKIIAAFLTEGELDEIKQRQPPIPADEVVVTLKQALAGVLSRAGWQRVPVSICDRRDCSGRSGIKADQGASHSTGVERGLDLPGPTRALTGDGTRRTRAQAKQVSQALARNP
jgi:hypothetical protein